MAEKDKATKKRKRPSVVVHQNDNRNDDGDLTWTVDAQTGNDTQTASQPTTRQSKKAKTSGKEGKVHVSKSGIEKQHGERELDTSKPSAVFKPKQGRDWTLSIALPGSFVNNVRTYEQKAALAGRIARAAAVFCVDEIIVFDDDPETVAQKPSRDDQIQLFNQLLAKKRKGNTKADVLADIKAEDQPWWNPDQFLFHLLSYMESPPNLRTYLFPMHPNLKGAGALPSLDMPHHLKNHEWCQYREGVTLDSDPDALAQWYAGKVPEPKQTRSPRKKNKTAEESTLVDCGLPHPVKVPVEIPPNVRVTIKFANTEEPPNWPDLTKDDVEALQAEAAPPSTPREEEGYYWGYTVRRADAISAVYTECPFEDEYGYDIAIGTSERGVPLSSMLPTSSHESRTPTTHANGTLEILPERFHHLLLVFGGVPGLEPAIVADPVMRRKGLTKERAGEAFDAWVNLVPGQGSRTIRTEEAVWVGLMGLREYISSME